MLPEELRDAPNPENSFQQALYELDYGMSIKQLMVELQQVDSQIIEVEMISALLNMKRSKLCDAIIQSTDAKVILVNLDGENVAAQVDFDGDNVEIVSVLIDDSCEVHDGNL